jgi:hypothetical protein
MGPSPSGRRLGRAGTGRLGCLVRLALLVAAGYYAFHLLEPYVRYLRARDVLDQQAAFAVNLTDDQIRHRVQEEVQKLGLPAEAQRVHIHREPGEKITIWIQYTETIQLPGFKREFTFTPRVERTLWRL